MQFLRFLFLTLSFFLFSYFRAYGTPNSPEFVQVSGVLMFKSDIESLEKKYLFLTQFGESVFLDIPNSHKRIKMVANPSSKDAFKLEFVIEESWNGVVETISNPVITAKNGKVVYFREKSASLGIMEFSSLVKLRTDISKSATRPSVCSVLVPKPIPLLDLMRTVAFCSGKSIVVSRELSSMKVSATMRGDGSVLLTKFKELMRQAGASVSENADGVIQFERKKIR